MAKTCAQRVTDLLDRLKALERQVKYAKDQFDYTIQRIADLRAKVCDTQAATFDAGCCGSITEFESNHTPPADYHTPCTAKLTTARNAILGIMCLSSDWKVDAYTAMECLEEAEQANEVFQEYVDLWISFLNALHESGCVLKAEPAEVE